MNKEIVILAKSSKHDEYCIAGVDITNIDIIRHNPTISQPENYIYNSAVAWKKTGVSSLEEVIAFRGYDRVGNTFYNTKKEVSENELGGQASLLLVNVKNSKDF